MLDAAFAALADPTRRAIVARLTDGPATVSTLAAPYPMTLPAVLKHLAVLEDGGLITRTKHGRTVTCTLRPAGLRDTAAFFDHYRQFWTSALDRLATFTETETS